MYFLCNLLEMYKTEFPFCNDIITTMSHTGFVLFSVLILFQGRVSLGIENRIVNGYEAWLGEFPYQVSLQINGWHNCGGTIIDNYHVLTAAHCVAGFSPRVFNVVVGSVNLKNFKFPASNHKVVLIYVHENYKKGNGWQNDIALIKVDTPFQFNKYVAPAKLPVPHLKLRDGQQAVVSGFGRLSDKSKISTILYKTNVFIENQFECQRVYRGDKIRPTNVCVRNPIRVTGFCRGDSGGPISIEGVVIGIVSFSLENGCASPYKLPQVCTRVSEYIDWIYSRIRN